MSFNRYYLLKCFLSFLLLPFFLIKLSGQLDTGYVKLKPNLESFELVMSLEENPTISQIKTINRLSYVYIFRNADTCLILAKKAHELSEKNFAQEEERKRIARDLYDGVGQSLLLIKKQLFFTHEVTQENQELITDTLEEVRSISRDLHPIQLEKFGLTAAASKVRHRLASIYAKALLELGDSYRVFSLLIV